MAEKHPGNGCEYFGGRWENVKCCDYYLITGKRRPCPAGKECIVRSERKSSRKKAMAVSEEKHK